MANLSGTTHIVKAMAEEQAALGHDVSVWYCDRPGQPPVLPAASVKTREFPITLPLMNPGVSLPFARAIAGGVRAFDVVHIHAVWNFPTLTTMRAACRAGVPYVVAPQGSLEMWALRHHRMRKGLYARFVEKPWMDRAAAIQALTGKEAAQVREFGVRAPVEILPNGIRAEDFAQRADGAGFRARHGVPADAKVLLFLGRLNPKKGLEILAECFAKVAAQCPDAALVIAGADPGDGFGERVRGFVRDAGVADRTRIVGEVRGADKYAAFASADVFILPSWSEGLPMAALEAMAGGVPVVLTEHCNIPEAAESGAGRVVRLDAGELAAAVVELFQDDSLRRRCSANGCRLTTERFAWRAISARAVDMYRRAIGESAA